MEKNTVKCPRCGTEYKLTVQKVFDGVSCPHCNKKMMMDKKTKRRLKFLRYLVVFGICVIVMYSAKTSIEKNYAFGILVVITLLAVMYLLSQFADRLCGRLLFHTVGLNYVEYVEEEKKEQRKK